MPHGKIQLWERSDYTAHFDKHFVDLVDDEAYDMRDSGVDIFRCIRRADGIHISGQQHGIRYEIHFDPQNSTEGYYSVSDGTFQGSGRVVEVRETKTTSFLHYYYVKVISQATNHFAWRIAIASFSTITNEV
jgi:hypothetical protein